MVLCKTKGRKEEMSSRKENTRNFNVFTVFLPKSSDEISASRIGTLVILINNLAENNWKSRTKHKEVCA